MSFHASSRLILHADVSYIIDIACHWSFFPILPVLATFWIAKTPIFFHFPTPNFCQPLRKKASFSAASAQLRSCRKTSQNLRKSRRYWHLRKSRFLRWTAEKLAFTKLLRNSAEKLQKSRLFYSFYEAFTQSFVKIVMMSKSCGNAAITQVPIPPAFPKLLHTAFTQVFYADLRKSCIKAT